MQTTDSTLPTTFEEVMAELSAILDQLETGDLSLEKSIQLYERGAELSRHGQSMLTEAQLKIDKLTRLGLSGVESRPYTEGQ
jgi:exodeoxyribonuclease VII small subunit